MTGEGMATMPEPNIQIHIQVEDECDGFINETSLSGKARDVLKHLTGIVREWEQEDGDWAVIKELKPCRDCGSTAIQIVGRPGCWWGCCYRCKTTGELADTEEYAAELWNSEGHVRRLSGTGRGRLSGEPKMSVAMPQREAQEQCHEVGG